MFKFISKYITVLNIYDQIKAAMVSIRDFFKKILPTSNFWTVV